MVRLIPFILCILLAIASGIVLALGYQAQEQNARLQNEVFEATCAELLDETPVFSQQILLSEFKVSPKIAHFDFDEDGKWDQTFVCFFSTTKKISRHHYRAVIVDVGGVTNRNELDKVIFDKESLSMFFWENEQAVPDHVYAGLATKFKNMDFQNSLMLKTNYPPPSTEMAEMFLLGGKGGLVVAAGLFILALLYNAIRFILPKRSEFDDEPEATTNRAGLPVS